MVFFAFQTFIHFNIYICLLCPPLSLSSHSKGKSTFYLTYHMCVVCGLHNKINNNYNTNTNTEIIKLNSIARKCRRFLSKYFFGWLAQLSSSCFAYLLMCILLYTSSYCFFSICLFTS